MSVPHPNGLEIPALRVAQWLDEWNKVEYEPKLRRRKPDDYFYLFTLPAPRLKALTGVYRRTTEGGARRSDELGIQRRHDRMRSEEIRRFVIYGFPWSELSGQRRQSQEFNDLRKPGWLPTALVVNILRKEDVRGGRNVAREDLVTIEEGLDSRWVTIKLPELSDTPDWRPRDLPPLEVIDGQHRLWAFEEAEFAKDFHLPVVAYHGLDISWQAYLFGRST